MRSGPPTLDRRHRQINMATGAVMNTIDTGSGTLYGLSVDDQLEVANPQNTSPTGPPPEQATLERPDGHGHLRRRPAHAGVPTLTDSSGNPSSTSRSPSPSTERYVLAAGGHQHTGGSHLRHHAE